MVGKRGLVLTAERHYDEPISTISGGDEAFLLSGKDTIEILAVLMSSERKVEIKYDFNRHDRCVKTTHALGERFKQDPPHLEEVARFALVIRNGSPLIGAGNSFRVAYPEIFRGYADLMGKETIYGGFAFFDGEVSPYNVSTIEQELRPWGIRVRGFPKSRPSRSKIMPKLSGIRKGLELVVASDNIVEMERQRIENSNNMAPLIRDPRFCGIWVGEERIDLQTVRNSIYDEKSRITPRQLLESALRIYHSQAS